MQGEPRLLTIAAGLEGSDGQLALDSSQAVFRADYNGDFEYEVYAVPLDGSTAPLQISPSRNFGFPALVTPDSQKVMFISDGTTQFLFDLYIRPIDDSTPPLRINNPLSPGGAVWGGFELTRDGTQVVFQVRYGYQGTPSSTPDQLYVAPLNGSQPPILLSDPSLAHNIDNFHISGDGSRVIYRTSATNQWDLITVPITGGTAKSLNMTATTGRPVSNWQLNATGQYAVYGTSLNSVSPGGWHGLYSVRIDGSAAPTQLSQSGATNDLVRHFYLDTSGQHVVFFADPDNDSRFDYYVRPTDGSGAPVSLTANKPAPQEFNTFQAYAYDKYFVYPAAGSTADSYDLYSVPLDGTRDPIKLNSGDFFLAYKPVFPSPDKTRVLFLETTDPQGNLALYSAPTDGSGTPVFLDSGFKSTGQLYAPTLFFTPDGTQIVYLRQTGSDPGFYTVPIAGGAPPQRISGQIAGPYSVWNSPITSDGHTFVFRAQGNNGYQLYATTIPTVVPEPSTVCLVMLGIMMLSLLRIVPVCHHR